MKIKILFAGLILLSSGNVFADGPAASVSVTNVGGPTAEAVASQIVDVEIKNCQATSQTSPGRDGDGGYVYSGERSSDKDMPGNVTITGYDCGFEITQARNEISKRYNGQVISMEPADATDATSKAQWDSGSFSFSLFDRPNYNYKVKVVYFTK
jgi:hypothetical protein